MLTDQYKAFGRSAISFKYREVEYTVTFDGGVFCLTNNNDEEKCIFSDMESLAKAECLDGIAPEKVWEHISDVVLRT